MSIELNRIQIVNTGKINNNPQNLTFNGTTHPIPNDSVELSTKKKGMSNGAKIASVIGIVGVIVSGIFIHKHLHKNKIIETFKSVEQIDKKFAKLEQNLPEVQKKFKEVFLRNDLTEEQTREILRGYKEVEKLGLTSTKEEYVKAVFEQAKKNYQIYNPSMTIDINSTRIWDGAFGGCAHDNGAICLTKRGMQESNSRLFEIIHHELRHAKQNECLYNYLPDGAIRGLIYEDYVGSKYYKNADDLVNFMREIKKEIGTVNIYYKAWQQAVDKRLHVEKIIEERFGKPNINKVPEEYRKTVEQINKEARTKIKYQDRTEEKDAFKIGNMMRELIFG